MKRGKDVAAPFPGLYVVHQNLPGKHAEVGGFAEHLLFFPLQGEIKVQLGTRTFSLGPGQMLYLPPQQPHTFSSSLQSGERLIAMLAPRLAPKAPHGPRCLPVNQLIKEVLFYLLLHPKTKNAASLVKVFAETLGEILAQAPTYAQVEHLEGRAQDPRLQSALASMRAKISDKFSIDEIARQAGLSPRNFHRLVLKETGWPPREWAIQFRVERAQELLKKPGASVTEVALAVGYQSLSQFIAAFRARTGQLPSDFLRHG